MAGLAFDAGLSGFDDSAYGFDDLFLSNPVFVRTPTGFTVSAASMVNGNCSAVITGIDAAQPANSAFDSSAITSAVVADGTFTLTYSGKVKSTIKVWLQINTGTVRFTTSVIYFTQTKGDELSIQVSGSVIASGVSDKDISFHGDLLEVTNGKSGGWREYSDLRSTRALSIQFSGYAYSNQIRTYFTNDAVLISNGSLNFADGTKMTGVFSISSYSESHKIGKIVEFKCEIIFSGQVAITA